MTPAEALRELAEIDRVLFEPIPVGEATEIRGQWADAMWRAAVVAQERQRLDEFTQTLRQLRDRTVRLEAPAAR